MASKLFSTKRVVFGAAPFDNARVGVNAAAGCLNLLVPGARCGAIELLRGLGKVGEVDISTQGTTCKVGKAPHVAIEFETVEQVAAFEACLRGEAVPVPQARSQEQTDIEPAPCTPPGAVAEDMGKPAPSTPPARGAVARLEASEQTPQRVKRMRVAEPAAVEVKKGA